MVPNLWSSISRGAPGNSDLWKNACFLPLLYFSVNKKRLGTTAPTNGASMRPHVKVSCIFLSTDFRTRKLVNLILTLRFRLQKRAFCVKTEFTPPFPELYILTIFAFCFPFRLLTVPNQNGYHSPMQHPHSPSPGLVSPSSVIHKKELDVTTPSSTPNSVRANLKLLVNSSQLAAKAKEEVRGVVL